MVELPAPTPLWDVSEWYIGQSALTKGSETRQRRRIMKSKPNPVVKLVLPFKQDSPPFSKRRYLSSIKSCVGAAFRAQ